MRTHLSVIVAVCFSLMNGTTRAANLDDPAIAKPTNRSEITRGIFASLACDPYAGDMSEFQTCIEHVLATAAVNNAVTPAFQVGLTWKAFYFDAIRFKTEKALPAIDRVNHAITKKAFDAYQHFADQVGVTTQQICEVNAIDKATCDIFLDLAKYWSEQRL